MVLLVGAYFTYRQVMNSREQLRIAQEGQITERFTRAIDQLGHAQVDVRIGGIYALARIARDSTSDLITIGQVLTAFIRSHAPWPPRLPNQPAATLPIDQVEELQVWAPDVQASLDVLGRGRFFMHPAVSGLFNLRATDLRRANMHGVLGPVQLDGAHLENANLTGTYMSRASLTEAHLEGASLEGANLKGANLDGVHLEGAIANEYTSWPDGFDWRAAGVIMADEDAAASPSEQV
jgi:hypothetical protein